MKYYCTGEPVGEYFKVVIPEMKEPIFNEKNYPAEADGFQYMNDKEKWEEHLTSLPQAALTKINKKGFLENVEERYEGAVSGTWQPITKDHYDILEKKEYPPQYRRIILVEETKWDLRCTAPWKEEQQQEKGEMLRKYYVLYESATTRSATASFIATGLADVYKQFEQRFGKPEPQIIEIHSEPINSEQKEETKKESVEEEKQTTSQVVHPFNEISLQKEIHHIWGEYGAHADVYREVLKVFDASKAPEERGYSQEELWDGVEDYIFDWHVHGQKNGSKLSDLMVRLKENYSITPKAE